MQLSYAIGVAKPISIYVDAKSQYDNSLIVDFIKENFPLTPYEFISKFELTKPIFSDTATYGHFKDNTPWEDVHGLRVAELFTKFIAK